MYQGIIKPSFDKIMSLLLLLFLIPIFLTIAAMLFLFQKGSVLFFQDRAGKDGKIFKLIKFKTMSDDLDSKGQLLSDSTRLTPIGKIVRKTSIDELPQLLNVLKGDMSLIGPRPLLVDYLPFYNNNHIRRHEVRPGISGWAQVNGRNSISWVEKFDYDIWYVDHVTFWLDLKIFLLTIKKVILSEGISAQGVKTMPRFDGHN